MLMALFFRWKCTDGIITLITMKVRKRRARRAKGLLVGKFHRIIQFSQSFSVCMNVIANIGKSLGRFAKLFSHVVQLVIESVKRMQNT